MAVLVTITVDQPTRLDDCAVSWGFTWAHSYLHTTKIIIVTLNSLRNWLECLIRKLAAVVSSHVAVVSGYFARFSSPHCWKVYCRFHNKGRFCKNSEIDILNSKRFSVESKAKLETQTPPPLYCLFTISSWESFTLFSTDNLFEIRASISLLLQNLVGVVFKLRTTPVYCHPVEYTQWKHASIWLQKHDNIPKYFMLNG